jgi:hypothetical protein
LWHCAFLKSCSRDRDPIKAKANFDVKGRNLCAECHELQFEDQQILPKFRNKIGKPGSVPS